MLDNVYYDTEGVLNKSLLIWIKIQNLNLKDSILYLLNSYKKTNDETELYMTSIESSIQDWFLFIDKDGMRLVYKPKISPDHLKCISLKDIFYITVLDAKLNGIL